MLCVGLQWPDATFGAGSNPGSRAMRIAIGTALVAVLLASSGSYAEEQGIRADLIEWVFEPCMDVAAALEVGGLEESTRDSALGRKVLTQFLLVSRDASIREMSANLEAEIKPDAKWQDLRVIYASMLRICLAQTLNE